MVGEFSKQLSRVLLVLFWYLRVDDQCKHIPFCLWKCLAKSGHGFRAFGCNPIFFAIKGFSRIDVIFHDTEVPEENFKCTAVICWCGIEDERRGSQAVLCSFSSSTILFLEHTTYCRHNKFSEGQKYLQGLNHTRLKAQHQHALILSFLGQVDKHTCQICQRAHEFSGTCKEFGLVLFRKNVKKV